MNNFEPSSIRALGINIGHFPTGEFNNITDVSGVSVGHSTLNNEKNTKTGVTIIHPNKDIFNKKLIAGSFVLNGAGELSGITQIQEWGLIETPIGLTNTMSVGQVSQGISRWMAKKNKNLWDQRYVVIPVVGECDDSFLNDCVNFPLEEKHVLEAINNGQSGPILQGSVGAGTGMVCCDFKAGIGSSSRMIDLDGTKYTIGVLVLANFGYMKDLRVDGFPIGKLLYPRQGNYDVRKDNYGSIITVIATDLPSSTHQLNRLCKRAALGIGRLGSFAAHGSGEIVFGFSTSNVIRHGKKGAVYKLNNVMEDHMNLPYQAVIEATEEAVLNSLTFSSDTVGVDGHFAPGIDKDALVKLYRKYSSITL